MTMATVDARVRARVSVQAMVLVRIRAGVRVRVRVRARAGVRLDFSWDAVGAQPKHPILICVYADDHLDLSGGSQGMRVLASSTSCLRAMTFTPRKGIAI